MANGTQDSKRDTGADRMSTDKQTVAAGELPELDVTEEDRAYFESMSEEEWLTKYLMESPIEIMAIRRCRERQLRTALTTVRTLADRVKELEEMTRSGYSSGGVHVYTPSAEQSKKVAEWHHAHCIDPQLRQMIRDERSRAEAAESSLAQAETKGWNEAMEAAARLHVDAGMSVRPEGKDAAELIYRDQMYFWAAKTRTLKRTPAQESTVSPAAQEGDKQ